MSPKNSTRFVPLRREMARDAGAVLRTRMVSYTLVIHPLPPTRHGAISVQFGTTARGSICFAPMIGSEWVATSPIESLGGVVNTAVVSMYSHFARVMGMRSG